MSERTYKYIGLKGASEIAAADLASITAMSEHEPKPVAWRNEHGAVTNFQHGADAWRDAGILSEPLYPASVVTALQEEVGRLKARLVEDKATVWLSWYERAGDLTVKLAAAEARANAAEQRLKEAVRVLEPFVRLDEGFIGQRTDEDIAQVTWTPNGPHKITFGQIRAARAFIKEIDQ